MEYAIGVDIGGTKIHFAIVDKQGHIVRQEIVPTEAALGANQVMAKVLNGIEGLIGSDASAFTGIGIGSAGQIDFNTGSVSFAVDTLPGWTGTPIKQLVEDRFGIKTYVDNDVNVIAIAEKCFGAGKQFNHFVCLALGTGVGGAVVEDGRLVRGITGAAGELGHISVNFNGPRCSCGNYGCIELYASGTGIARIAKEQIAQNGWSVAWEANSRSVIKAWTEGDQQATAVMDIVICALGTAISGLIHTFNPEAIIIGGGVSDTGKVFFDAVEAAAKERTSPSMWSRCRIIPSYVGVNSGVIGAAAQVWHYEGAFEGSQVTSS